LELKSRFEFVIENKLIPQEATIEKKVSNQRSSVIKMVSNYYFRIKISKWFEGLRALSLDPHFINRGLNKTRDGQEKLQLKKSVRLLCIVGKELKVDISGKCGGKRTNEETFVKNGVQKKP
jgi:hypothetical protein